MSSSSGRTYAARLAPEARREQLLDAALALIVAQGYGGVSMEAIAHRAGVSKPVVYDAFGSRAEFFRALLAREEARALAAIAAAMPAPTPDARPEDLVVEGVDRLLRTVAADPGPWRLILIPVEGTPSVVREHVARNRALVLARLQELVAAGLAQLGEAGARVDAEVAAHAIFAVAEHFARLAVDDPGRIDPARVTAFVGGVAAGLRAPGPR